MAAFPQQRYPAGILSTCVVPWTERFDIDEARFRAQVRRFLQHGIRNLYIFGTAGEGHAVDTSRFRDVAALFAEETRHPDVLPQAGVIAQSSHQAIERLRIAYDLGFRVFQLTLPCWVELTDAEVVHFFRGVCGTFPDCRFLHYDLDRAKRRVSGALYRRIADQVPNLAATKMTGADPARARDVLEHAGDIQHFFTLLYAEGRALGSCSLLGTWAAQCPGITKRQFAAGEAGNLHEAARLQRELFRMDETVFAPIRHLRISDAAYDKLRVMLGGETDFPLRLLPPYETIPPELAAECLRLLRTHFPGWEE